MRKKTCNHCQLEFQLMYRVQYQKTPTWSFLCKDCLLEVKPNNPFYRYWGIWKA